MASPKQRDSDNWLPPPPWEGLPPLFGAPWERQEEEEPRAPRRVATDRPQVKPPTASVHLSGPGCKAADACGVVLYYLTQLSEGKSGFGVLRVAKERMEEGAVAATHLGKTDLAASMQSVAQALPEIRTPEAAAALVPRLKALCDQTWELGRLCGGHVSPAVLQQARDLAAKVKKGEVSRDQALAQLRQSTQR